MNGLQLSELYCKNLFFPACERRIPQVMDHLAVGLVGEGSECFGYDDELSRDHGFGIRLCVWLSMDDYVKYEAVLSRILEELPDTFMGFSKVRSTVCEGKRSGIYTIGEFYRNLTGFEAAPESVEQWLVAEEPSFAAATNGRIFYDGPGKFTEIRNSFLKYYPEDVIRYYLAKNAALAAQSGQYNYLRACRRKDELACINMKAVFTQRVIAMIFLLNKTYRPFYKWAPRKMRSLPILGEKISDMLIVLNTSQNAGESISLIETISGLLIEEMKRQEYTAGNSTYMMDHVPQLISGIQTPELRNGIIKMVL